MNYLQFREQWLGLGCFSIYQLRAWNSTLDSSSISRWVKKGYLSKIRQDWYAFCELQNEPDMARFIAGKIYSPSYISLHTALSIYGIIPEAVTQITCVTTNRTASYNNPFGQFHYQTIKPELFFGYKQEPVRRGGSYLVAADAMLDLRFDTWWMQEELDKEKIMAYAKQTAKKALINRIELLLNTYDND